MAIYFWVFSVISSAKNVLEKLERLPQILVTDFDVIFVLEFFDMFSTPASQLAKVTELAPGERGLSSPQQLSPSSPSYVEF